MYRAITLKVLDNKLDLDDKEKIVRLAQTEYYSIGNRR